MPTAPQTTAAWPILALAMVAFTLSETPAASAAPSLDKALTFAETTLSGLCNDSSRSRLIDRVGETRSRSCYTSLAPGRLVLEVRYRSAHDPSDRSRRNEMGVFRQEVLFDRHAYFYCSTREPDGMATLYMNCKGATNLSDRSCAMEEWTRRSDTRPERTEQRWRSFAGILRTLPGTCRVVKNAMNYIAERSRGGASNSPEVYFSQH